MVDRSSVSDPSSAGCAFLAHLFGPDRQTLASSDSNVAIRLRDANWHPVWALYAVLTLYFTAPLLVTGDALGISDWDAILLHHAAVVKNAYEYGQLPFWNPWYCGGNVLWQNPQVPLLSPVYALTGLLGLPLAIKINIFLHYLLGFVGMHLLLTRLFKLSFAPAVFFLASLFTLAGGPALHLTVGHNAFLPYFYLPLLLLLFVRAIETGGLKHLIGAAGLIALTIYNGGIHVAVMSAVAMTCFSVFAVLCRRDWRPLGLLGILGALGALYAAPKLLPAVVYVTDQRVIDVRYLPPQADRMSTEMLVRALLDPFQFRRLMFPGQNYGWHEYGNYIGSFGALLMMSSFIWVIAERPWMRQNWLGVSLALTALLLLLLTAGEFSQYAPFVLLRKLPGLSQFRLPSRYGLVFTLFGTAMIAWVARASVSGAVFDARVRRLAAIMLTLASCQLAYHNRAHFQGAFSLPPLDGGFHFLARSNELSIDPSTDGIGGDSPMLRAMMQGRAVLRCNEPLQLPGAVDASKPLVFSQGEADVSRIVFSPNRIEFRALPRRAQARVFLNQRYINGWRSNVGRLAIDQQTNLAYVTLAKDQAGRFWFSFFPPGLLAGLILFGAGLTLAVLIWNRRFPGPTAERYTDT